MIFQLLSDLKQFWAGIAHMYADRGVQAGKIRAEHLGAVMRLTPYAMAANVGSACLVLWALSDRHGPGLYAWFLSLLAVALVSTHRWARCLGKPLHTASPRAVRRATWQASVLALLWSWLPIGWFASASSGQQLFIATLFSGMLSAGTFVLNPLPKASLAYASIFSVAAWWALWSAADPMMAGVAVLMGFYAPMNVVGALSTWRKSTALLISRSEAIRQEQLLAVVFQDFEQSANEALWEIGTDGRLAQTSPRLSSLLRLPATPTAHTSLPDWIAQHSASTPDTLATAFATALDKQTPFHSLPVALTVQGERFHLAFTGKPIQDEWGQVSGWRGVVADKTSMVQAQEQLERLAHSDSLTQLANRFCMHQAIAQAMQAGQGGALLLIDLDAFKSINDRLGHSVGDAVLQQVAQRLQSITGAAHLVARLGGDEFAVLLRQPPAAAHWPADAQAQAQAQAQALVEALTQPLAVDGRRLRIGASVGVALFAPGSTDVDALLVQADTALYAAKDQGRGRYTVYTQQMGDKNQRKARLESDLREAIQRQELSLLWQPQIDMASGQIAGVESVLRWQHTALGNISPVEFIAIAEQSGAIDALGRWVLQQACAAAVQEPALSGLDISINVSALQLREADFVPQVQAALVHTGLAPQRLELEITESVFIDDAPWALQQLHALRALGVRIALDDFGTGYSSLSYLSQFPFHTLKIDRSFVQKATEHPCSHTIVKSIVQMASSLGMRTVAEGVETPEQLRMLSAMGTTLAQGYLLSRPCTLEAIGPFRQGWQAETVRREQKAPVQ